MDASFDPLYLPTRRPPAQRFAIGRIPRDWKQGEPAIADQKRGDDAGDHAPKPKAKGEANAPKKRKQDAPNYDERVDGGRAVATEDISSANDE